MSCWHMDTQTPQVISDEVYQLQYHSSWSDPQLEQMIFNKKKNAISCCVTSGLFTFSFVVIEPDEAQGNTVFWSVCCLHPTPISSHWLLFISSLKHKLYFLHLMAARVQEAPCGRHFVICSCLWGVRVSACSKCYQWADYTCRPNKSTNMYKHVCVYRQ